MKPLASGAPGLFHESRVAQVLPAPFDSLRRHFPWRRFVITRQCREGAFVPTAVEGNLEVEHNIGIAFQQRNGDEIDRALTLNEDGTLALGGTGGSTVDILRTLKEALEKRVSQ